MVLLENDTRLTLSDETVLSFLVRNIAFLLVTHVITAAVTTIFFTENCAESLAWQLGEVRAG